MTIEDPTIPEPTADEIYDGVAGGVEVEGTLTPHSPIEIRSILSIGYYRTFGIAIDSTTLTLAACMIELETAHGAAIHNENWGNVGRGKYLGDYEALRARERINGVDVMRTQYIRAHDSAIAGAADYWDYIAKNYPLALAAIRRGDVAGAAHEFKVRYYFTEDEAKYAKVWADLVRESDRKWPRKS